MYSIWGGAILDFVLNLIVIPKIFSKWSRFVNTFGRRDGSSASMLVLERCVVELYPASTMLENRNCTGSGIRNDDSC